MALFFRVFLRWNLSIDVMVKKHNGEFPEGDSLFLYDIPAMRSENPFLNLVPTVSQAVFALKKG